MYLLSRSEYAASVSGKQGQEIGSLDIPLISAINAKVWQGASPARDCWYSKLFFLQKEKLLQEEKLCACLVEIA
jgi:hypothetical protein